VLTNPNARKNRRRPGHADRLRRAVGDLGVVIETPSVDDIGAAVQALLALDLACWVADGGDGALHWMLNAARDALGSEASRAIAIPPVLPTKGGTIDFVAKKVGLHGDTFDIVGRAVDRVRRGEPIASVEIDSLLAQGSGAPGPFERIGFASAIAGVGQQFFDQYYALPDPGPASIVRVVGRTVAGLALGLPGVSHLPGLAELRGEAEAMVRSVPAEVWLDGQRLPFRDFSVIHVGAIDVDLGGVFRVFPLAARDGVLHVQAGSLAPTAMVRNIPNLACGRRIVGSNFVETEAQELRALALEGRAFRPVIDGEVYEGVAELRVTLGPRVAIAFV
jgi:hypothetical protein